MPWRAAAALAVSLALLAGLMPAAAASSPTRPVAGLGREAATALHAAAAVVEGGADAGARAFAHAAAALDATLASSTPEPGRADRRERPGDSKPLADESRARLFKGLAGAAAAVSATAVVVASTASPAAASANPTINPGAATSPAAAQSAPVASVAIQPGGTTTSPVFFGVNGSAGTGGYLKKYDPATGLTTSVAGGAAGACVNGSTGLTSSFGAVRSIATDGTNLYSVTGDCPGLIRKTVISTGATSTLTTVTGANFLTIVGSTLYITTASAVWKAGTGNRPNPASFATLDAAASAITPDTPGASPAALYVAEDIGTSHQVQKIVLSTAAVSTVPGASSDLGLTGLVGYAGYLYDTAQGGAVVRGINPADGTWTNIAGSGSAGLADGAGTDAWFNGAASVASDGTNLWVADGANDRLRKLAPAAALPSSQPGGATAPVSVEPGAVTTTAGNGANATADNASGLQASFRDMGGAVVIGSTLYVGTVGAVRTMSIASGHAVATLAGDAAATGCVDSTSSSAARFGAVSDVATDTYYLYVSDASCGIRRVSTTGVTSTLTPSFAGAHLTFANGTLYATSGSTVVAIDRVNGTSSTLFTAGGPPSALTSDGSLVYVVDTAAGVNRILKEPFGGGAFTVVASSGVGTTALASTRDYLYNAAGSVLRRYSKADGTWSYVAGTTTPGFADGNGSSVALAGVTGLVSDGSSSLWVADSGNHRVRFVQQGNAQPASAATNLALDIGQSDTVASGLATVRASTVVNGVAYVAGNGAVRTVNLATQSVGLLAGSLTSTGCVDSADPAAARFGQLTDVTTDGYFLYAVDPDCSGTAVRKIDVSTGATTTLFTQRYIDNVTLGPDGFLYATLSNRCGGGCNQYDVEKVDPITGAATDLLAWPTGDTGPITANGASLYYVVTTPTLAKINQLVVSTGAVSTFVSGLPATPLALAAAGAELYVAQPTAVRQYLTTDGSWKAVAGNLSSGSQDGTGTDAWFSSISGLAVSGAQVVVVDANSTLRTLVAGSALPASQPASDSADLVIPTGQVATKATGISAMRESVVVGRTAYVATSTSVQQVDLASGALSLLAGSASASGCVNSTDPTQVRFGGLTSITTDGHYVYVVDPACGGTYSAWVRRVALANGATSLVVNTSQNTARFITEGPDGMLYATSVGTPDGALNVLQINPVTAAVTTLLSGTTTSSTPGPITADATSIFYSVWWGSSGYAYQRVLSSGATTTVASGLPFQIAGLASAGSQLYLAGSTAVRAYAKASPSSWHVVAGTSGAGVADATGTDAWFNGITGVTSDGSTVWVSDAGNGRLRSVVPAAALPSGQPAALTATTSISPGRVSTFAGSGSTSTLEGVGTAAGFAALGNGVVVGGYLYEASDGVVRRVDLASGSVTTFAGSPGATGCVDSSAPGQARFGRLGDITTDGYYLYVTDEECGGSNHTYVRRVSLATGATSTVADTYPNAFQYVTMGPDGFLYASVQGNSSVTYDLARIDPQRGTITLLLGMPTGFAGPVTADASNVYYAMDYASTPRVYKWSIAAGTSTPLSSPTNEVTGMASAGQYLYLASATAVSRLDKTTLATQAVAGSSGAGFADGDGAGALFSSISGVTTNGPDLWVSDTGNRRIRRVIQGPVGGGLTTAEAPSGTNLCWACLSQFIQSMSGLTAYPVTAWSGNFYHSFDDLSIPGRGPAIDVSRTYNSDPAFSTVNGVFGYGWTWSYGMSLTSTSTTATVVQEDGAHADFVLSSGSWVPAVPRLIATLTHNGDGTWTFVRKSRQTIAFDSSGRLTAITDLNGYTTTVSYPDASTEVVTDPAGRSVTLTLSGGRVVSLTDGSSPARSVSYAYDGAGNLAEATDVGGGHTTFTYDASHRLVTMRFPRDDGDTTTTPSPVVTNHYDAGGLVDWQSDQLGRVTSFDRTSVPGSVVVTDPKGNQVLYTYGDNLLTSLTKGYGTAQAATWRFSYDPQTTALTETVDPLGRVSKVYVDGRGNGRSTVDPLGRVTTTTYNSLDEPLTTTDGAGVTTTAQYDAAGKITLRQTPLLGIDGVTVAAWQTTTYAYAGPYPGDVTSIVDPVGHTWSYGYDTFGDVVSSTAPPTPENGAGNTTTYAYDTATGWLLSSVSPRGNVAGGTPSDYTTTYQHDAFGRVTVVRDPLWTSSAPTLHQTSRHYDADGNLDSATDGNGNTTAYAYDPAEQLTVVTRPDATTLRNDYWPDGSLKTQYDGADQPTSYAYDGLGRLTSATDPLGRATSYSYDAAGELTKVQDPGGNCAASPAVGCATRAYDAAGQLLSVAYSDGSTPGVSGLQYDLDGRRTRMTDGTGTSVWSYDSLGRLTASTNGAGSSLGYEYDLAGRPTVLVYPGGVDQVTRAYDGAGRLASVTDWASRATSYSYDPDSDLVGEALPNGDSVSSSFDRAGASSSSVLAGPGSPGPTLVSLSYGRDGASRLSSQSGSGVGQPAEAYGYDALSRLTGVNGSAAFAYDPADNLTRLRGATQAFDAANQLTSSTPDGGSATSFAYDARGDRTSATPPPGGGVAASYGWDQARRLASATVGSVSASYAYDGDGLRASKTVGGDSTPFTWDEASGLALAVVDGAESVVYGAGGLPLEQVAADGTAQWFFHDQLGSTRALTDSSGAVVATWSYDPYGAVVASSGTAATHFGFAGEYADAETGLVYLQARYYDPSTGLFLSRDPLVAQTRAAYGYVGGDPLDGSDPSGLCGAGATFNPFNKNNCLRTWAYDHPRAGFVTSAVAGGLALAIACVAGGCAAVAAAVGAVSNFCSNILDKLPDPWNPEYPDHERIFETSVNRVTDESPPEVDPEGPDRPSPRGPNTGGPRSYDPETSRPLDNRPGKNRPGKA